MSTPLGDRMRALAETTPAQADELRERARLFDEATEGFYGSGDVTARQFLGHYARARKLFCEITGEPLV